jgi:hypothetical protein
VRTNCTHCTIYPDLSKSGARWKNDWPPGNTDSERIALTMADETEEQNPASTLLPLSDTEESISFENISNPSSTTTIEDSEEKDQEDTEHEQDDRDEEIVLEITEREDIEVDIDIDFDTRTTVDIATTMTTRPSRWLASARTDQQAEGMAVAVKREDRVNLTADALLKLQKSSTEGMTHKFALMSHTTDDQLVECYNLSLRIEELKLTMKKTDTIGGFDIFDRAITCPETPMPAELPLIERIDELTEASVRASVRFKRYYGQTFDIQDLQWSQELIENSCDEDLRIKVLERLRPIPDVEQGGPLFYYTMIQLIQTDAEQAVRTLIDKLEHLSLKTLSGENIFTACSLIRGVLARLKSVNQVPHDVETTLLDILQTSSVEDFNTVFKTLSDSKFLGISLAKTAEEILILAERLYTRLLSKGSWTGVGRVGKSTFIANGQHNAAVADVTEQLAVPTCWNCGKNGHLSNECDQPKKRRGGDRPGKAKSWKRTPPGADDPHEKMVAGAKWYWCGRCCFWNQTHLSKDHVARQANLAEDEASQASKGSATTGSATTGSGEDADSSLDPRISFYGNVMRKMHGAKN